MTPAAHISAAIEVLDAWLAGAPAERALTDWGRAHRFAGSGDRAAIRDLVYDALRCRRSFAWAGGAETGRGLMLGRLRLGGTDPADLFTGADHAPAPVRAAETGRPPEEAPEPVRLDVPDWLWPRLQHSLGAEAAPAMAAQRRRAPVWLRVNAARTTVAAAVASLAEAGIATRPHPEVSFALEATENARRISASDAYAGGLVELQDVASQAVVAALGDVGGLEVLDFCAGGGGKALDLAARGALVTAHDANPARMHDLGPRAARAGVRIATATAEALPRHGPFPLVLVDAPCSGSGTWRRDPEGKWRLTPERLSDLSALQGRVLAQAARLVGPGGRLAYVTCSLLAEETAAPVESFLDGHPGWQVIDRRQFLPDAPGDGFSLAVLGH